MPLVLHRAATRVDPARLSGLTLFEGARGWQLSYAFRGEGGWVVRQVPPADARDILDALAACVVQEVPDLMPPSARRRTSAQATVAPRCTRGRGARMRRNCEARLAA